MTKKHKNAVTRRCWFSAPILTRHTPFDSRSRDDDLEAVEVAEDAVAVRDGRGAAIRSGEVRELLLAVVERRARLGAARQQLEVRRPVRAAGRPLDERLVQQQQQQRVEVVRRRAAARLGREPREQRRDLPRAERRGRAVHDDENERTGKPRGRGIWCHTSPVRATARATHTHALDWREGIKRITHHTTTQLRQQ